MAKEKKGRKFGRNKLRGQAKAYAAGMRLEINRKKRWRRVLRHQPNNLQLRARYEKEIGPVPAEITARARRKQERGTMAERLKLRARERKAARAAKDGATNG